MYKSFWKLCSHAFGALHEDKYAEAVSILNDAEAMLESALPNVEYLRKRKDYLKRMRKYVHGLIAIDKGPQVSKGNAPSPLETTSSNTLLAHLNAKPVAITEKLSLHAHDKIEIVNRLQFVPTIDPLCISNPEMFWPRHVREDLGIIVFGHTRLDTLNVVLESLRLQDALQYTEIWLDGYQGNPDLKQKIEKTVALVNQYPVKKLHRQSGQFGFRKMLILGLIEMCNKYDNILVLEDDCFPTRDAVMEFRKELDVIRAQKHIFSVYGHHFLVESEKETCPRFQGWGWATTSEKLMPALRQLIDCYSMTEQRYLDFVRRTLTPEIKAKIDVTPPRQPSNTLEKFFAWDETLCLLTSLNGQVHRPTRKRTVYNCGIGQDSAHFRDFQIYRAPAFNLITPDEVWQYY